MKIVNPLYDRAFKYLMQKERLARKVLSTILNQDVIELELSQQETVVPDEKHGFTLFRLDFKAVISDSNGKKQKVLIELQKSKFSTDLVRFRNYVGANYMNTETDDDDNGTERPAIYPIITIYILGYKIPDIPYMGVTVDRKILNSVNNKELDIDSFFINHLTHRSHILQVRRLPERRISMLEKFLVLFNQAWRTDKKYIIDLQEIPDEFQDVAEYLQGPVMDASFRRQLEVEEEIDQIFEEQEAKYERQIAEIMAEAERERTEKEQALAQIKRAVRTMAVQGVSKSVIADSFGIEEDEIQKILDDAQ